MLRLLDYKQSYLEDCWDTEIKIDQKTNDIIWKASETLNLTLKHGVNIVENREFYNPSFATLTFRRHQISTVAVQMLQGARGTL